MDNRKWSLGIISLAFLFIASSSAEFIIQQVTESNNSYNLEANLGVTRLFRDVKPSSKIVTITNISVMAKTKRIYESSIFEAAGYKWRMVLYVNGNEKDGGSGFISLYVRMIEARLREAGVDVYLKLFVYNPKQQNYLTVTERGETTYTNTKKEWGFGQLIDRSTFFDTDKGYTMGDIGTFGAEISIIKPAQQQEKFTIISNPPNNVFIWKIFDFSTLKDKLYSDTFLVGDRYWRLELHPNGVRKAKGNAISIFLFARGFKTNAVQTTTYEAFNLRLKNQINSNHKQIRSGGWSPIQGDYGSGADSIISLSELSDASKGFLVNDSIIFEVEMVKVSVTNIVPA